jgi:hypothetical protein
MKNAGRMPVLLNPAKAGTPELGARARNYVVFEVTDYAD